MSGVASTSGLGSLGHGGIVVALVGSAITCAQGQFADRHGQVVVSASGTLAPSIRPPALTGQAVSVGQGSVTVASTGGDDVTVHISGVEAQFQQSFVIQTQAVTGSASTFAAGTLAPEASKALTGSSSTLGIGSVIAGQDADDTLITSAAGAAAPGMSKALTGSVITVSQGTVIKDNKEASLSTASITSQQTAPSVNKSLVLTGILCRASQSAVGAPGFAALSGSEVSVLGGNFGKALALSGQAITISQGTILGLPGIVALVGESISVSQGTLMHTGTNWTEKPEPTTSWARKTDLTSLWTRKPNPTSSWRRK